VTANLPVPFDEQVHRPVRVGYRRAWWNATKRGFASFLDDVADWLRK
jgi:hypothetical protein